MNGIDPKKLQQLYEKAQEVPNLKIKDVEAFSRFMHDPAKRQQFIDHVRNSGYEGLKIKDADALARWLGVEDAAPAEPQGTQQQPQGQPTPNFQKPGTTSPAEDQFQGMDAYKPLPEGISGPVMQAPVVGEQTPQPRPNQVQGPMGDQPRGSVQTISTETGEVTGEYAAPLTGKEGMLPDETSGVVGSAVTGITSGVMNVEAALLRLPRTILEMSDYAVAEKTAAAGVESYKAGVKKMIDSKEITEQEGAEMIAQFSDAAYNSLLRRTDAAAKIALWMDKSADELSGQAQRLYESGRPYEKDFGTYWDQGDYAKAGAMLLYDSGASLPYLVAGYGGMAGMAVIAGSVFGETYNEYRDNGFTPFQSGTAATAYSAAEFLFERLGTELIQETIEKEVKRRGKQGATEILEKGLKSWLEKAYKTSKGAIAPLHEGASEWLTQVAQNAIDASMGEKEWTREDIFGGGLQSFLAGVVIGIPGAAKGFYDMSKPLDKSDPGDAPTDGVAPEGPKPPTAPRTPKPPTETKTKDEAPEGPTPPISPETTTTEEQVVVPSDGDAFNYEGTDYMYDAKKGEWYDQEERVAALPAVQDAINERYRQTQPPAPGMTGMDVATETTETTTETTEEQALAKSYRTEDRQGNEVELGEFAAGDQVEVEVGGIKTAGTFSEDLGGSIVDSDGEVVMTTADIGLLGGTLTKTTPATVKPEVTDPGTSQPVQETVETEKPAQEGKTTEQATQQTTNESEVVSVQGTTLGFKKLAGDQSVNLKDKSTLKEGEVATEEVDGNTVVSVGMPDAMGRPGGNMNVMLKGTLTPEEVDIVGKVLNDNKVSETTQDKSYGDKVMSEVKAALDSHRADRASAQEGQDAADSIAKETVETQKKTAPVKVKAPAGTYLNVGMVAGQTSQEISEDQILDALPEGVSVQQKVVMEAGESGLEERTMVLQLSRPLTDSEMLALRQATSQMAIPQLTEGQGVMYGTEDWGPFNGDYFQMPGRKTLTEQNQSTEETTETKTSNTAAEDLAIFESLYGKEPAAMVQPLFQRVLQTTAKRLGISMARFRQRLAVVTTGRDVAQVAGEIYRSMSDAVTRETHTLDYGVQYQGGASEVPPSFLSAVEGATADDKVLFRAVQIFPDIYNFIMNGTKRHINESLRAEKNEVEAQLRQAFITQASAEVIRPLIERQKELKKLLSSAETTQSTITKQEVEKLLENKLQEIRDKAQNTDEYYIQDFRDQDIDRRIAEIKEERRASPLELQAWEATKENSEVRSQQLQHVRNQQRAALMETLNYVAVEPAYSPAARAIVVNDILKYNVNKKGEIGSRNDYSFGNHYKIGSGTMPAVVEALEAGDPTPPLVVAWQNAVKDMAAPEEIQAIVAKYTAEKRPDGHWLKFPKSTDQETVADLYTIAKETHLPDKAAWCTGGSLSTAASHIENGDFYIFVDNQGQPRLAMRYEGNIIAEARGNRDGQGIEPEMLEEQLHFFKKYPGGQKHLDVSDFNFFYREYVEKGKPLQASDTKRLLEVMEVGDGSYRQEESKEKAKKLYGLLDAQSIAGAYNIPLNDVLLVSEKDRGVEVSDLLKPNHKVVVAPKGMLFVGEVNADAHQFLSSLRFSNRPITVDRHTSTSGNLFLSAYEGPANILLSDMEGQVSLTIGPKGHLSELNIKGTDNPPQVVVNVPNQSSVIRVLTVESGTLTLNTGEGTQVDYISVKTDGVLNMPSGSEVGTVLIKDVATLNLAGEGTVNFLAGARANMSYEVNAPGYRVTTVNPGRHAHGRPTIVLASAGEVRLESETNLEIKEISTLKIEGSSMTVELPHTTKIGEITGQERNAVYDAPVLKELGKARLFIGERKNNFPVLTTITDRLEIFGDSIYTDIGKPMPSLQSVGNAMEVVSAYSVEFPALESVGIGVTIASVKKFSAPNLKGSAVIVQRPPSYDPNDPGSLSVPNLHRSNILFGDRTGQESEGAVPYGYEITANTDDIQFQGERAALIRAGEKLRVLLGKNSDVTSPLHEAAHVFEEVLTPDERAAVLAWTGDAQWTRDTSEAFAKGFELYLYQGRTKAPGLTKIFQKFADFLKSVIPDAARYFGDINELNPEMIAIYDAMLGGKQETQAPTRKSGPPTVEKGAIFDHPDIGPLEVVGKSQAGQWKLRMTQGNMMMFLDESEVLKMPKTSDGVQFQSEKPMTSSESIDWMDTVVPGTMTTTDVDMDLPVVVVGSSEGTLRVPAGTTVIKLGSKPKKFDGLFLGDDIPVHVDGQGNAVLYHYGTATETVDPKFFGSKSWTSDKRSNGVSFYYIDPSHKEKFFDGQTPKTVKIPLSEVYDMSADPLGLYQGAKDRMARLTPAYLPNSYMDQAVAAATRLGFKAVVNHWPGGPAPYRAESGTSLPIQEAKGQPIDYSTLPKHSTTKQTEDVLLDRVAPGTLVQTSDGAIYYNGQKYYVDPQVKPFVADTEAITNNTKAKTAEIKNAPRSEETGATFNLDGTAYEDGGVVVGMDSFDTTQEELTDEMIADFVTRNSAKIAGGQVKVGYYKFENSNKVSIDLSVVVPGKHLKNALQVAAALGQESVYNIDTGKTEKTGHTGDNTAKLSDEAFQQAAMALPEGMLPQWMPQFQGPTGDNLSPVESAREAALEKVNEKAREVLQNNPVTMHNIGQEAGKIQVKKIKEFQQMLGDKFKEILPELKKAYGNSFNPYNVNWNDSGLKDPVNVKRMEVLQEYLVDALSIEVVEAAANPTVSAVGWYVQKVNEAMGVMEMVHPELSQSEEHRVAFFLALAITSNGMKVDKNFELAEAQYQHWKKTYMPGVGGRFDATVGGAQSSGINTSLEFLNRILDSGVSLTELNKVLTTEMTADLMKYRPSQGKSPVKLGSFAHKNNMKLYGASIFGQKIGDGFYMNLWGVLTQLTADRWFMRTFHRQMGTIIKNDPEGDKRRNDRLKAAFDAARKDPTTMKVVNLAMDRVQGKPKARSLSLEDLAAALSQATTEPNFRALMQPGESKFTREDAKGQPLGATEQQRINEYEAIALQLTPAHKQALDELRRAANSVAKDNSKAQEHPSSGTQLEFIQDTMLKVQDRVREITGGTIEMADIQASLWFPEKILYDAVKTKEKTKAEAEAEYAESPPDYSFGAQELVKKLVDEKGNRRYTDQQITDAARAGSQFKPNIESAAVNDTGREGQSADGFDSVYKVWQGIAKAKGPKAELAKSRDALKEAWDAFKNIGFAFDPKQQAEKQKRLYDALLRYAKAWIKVNVGGTLQDFQDAVLNQLGVPVEELKNRSYDIIRAFNQVTMPEESFQDPEPEDRGSRSARKSRLGVRLRTMLGVDPEADVKKSDLQTFRPQSQSELEAFAEAVIAYYIDEHKGNEEAGMEAAKSFVMDNSTLVGFSHEKRVAVGVVLAKRYNALASSGDGRREFWLDKFNDMYEALTRRGREYGRAVNAFKIFNQLSRDNIQAYLNMLHTRANANTTAEYQQVAAAAQQAREYADRTARERTANEADETASSTKSKGKEAKENIAKKKRSALDRFKGLLGGNVRFQPAWNSPGQSAAVKAVFGGDQALADAAMEYGYWEFADGKRTQGDWVKEMTRALGITADQANVLWSQGSTPTGMSFAKMADPASLSDAVRKHASDPVALESALGNLGYSQQDAQNIANKVHEKYRELHDKFFKANFKERNFKKIPKSLENLINSLGDPSTPVTAKQDIANEISKIVGIPPISSADMKKLSDMIAERDALPANSSLFTQKNMEIMAFIGDLIDIKSRKGMWGRTQARTKKLFWPVWYASILSGPRTQVINTAGNLINGMTHAFLFSAVELAKGNPRAVFYLTAGFVSSMGRAGKEFSSTLQGKAVQKGNKFLDTRSALEDYNLDGDSLIEQGRDLLSRPGNSYLAALKYVGRFMSAVDNAFYVLNSQSYLHAKAATEVRKMNPSLSGKALRNAVTEYLYGSDVAWEESLEVAREQLNGIAGIKESDINRRAREIMDQKVEMFNAELHQSSHDWGLLTTYNYEPRGTLGLIGKSLDQFIGHTKVGRFIVPFTRIVINVLNQQLDFTPYGFLRAGNVSGSAVVLNWTPATKELRHTQTQEERNLMLGKAAIGTMVMATIGLLRFYEDEDEERFISARGQGPQGWRSYSQLRAANRDRHVLKVGDVEFDYTYTPFGIGLALVNNAFDIQRYSKEEMTNLEVLGAALGSTPSVVLEMSFLKGLTDLISNLSNPPGREVKLTEKMVKSVSGAATSFIPRFLLHVDAVTEYAITGQSSVYQPRSLSDHFLKNVPVVRHLAVDKAYTAFGDEVNIETVQPFGVPYSDVVMKTFGFDRVVTPGKTDDPVLEYMAEADILGRLTNVGDPQVDGESLKEIDPDRFAEYYVEVTQATKKYVEENIPRLRTYSRDQQVESINKAIASYKAGAKLKITAERDSQKRSGERDLNNFRFRRPGREETDE